MTIWCRGENGKICMENRTLIQKFDGWMEKSYLGWQSKEWMKRSELIIRRWEWATILFLNESKSRTKVCVRYRRCNFCIPLYSYVELTIMYGFMEKLNELRICDYYIEE